MSSQGSQLLPGGVAGAGDADVVDAQLSALLESVVAEPAEASLATPPSRPVAAAPPSRPRRRPRTPAAKAARVPSQAPTRRVVRSGSGFAPSLASLERPWGRIPVVGDPALREAAYYAIVALVLGMGLGLLCARLLM